MNPIFVVAGRHEHARYFVTEILKEDPARLRYVHSEHQLRGIKDVLLYVYPTAHENRAYIQIMELARLRGLFVATINDTWHRNRYSSSPTKS